MPDLPGIAVVEALHDDDNGITFVLDDGNMIGVLPDWSMTQ